MARTVSIGKQDFAALRENNCFYIDKTSFIKEWWESEDDTTLITRPRRFGKTLNMSMVEHFFSIKYVGRSDLFEGLFIWQEEKYRQLQGTYPVISLSFARIKEKDYGNCHIKLCEVIRNAYRDYSFLKDSDVLDKADKKFFERMLSEEEEGKDGVMTSAIYQLSYFLEKHYGKKVIILLDEYDTPMQEAYLHGYWEEIVSFLRCFFNSTFKTNPYMERSLMTGITRVSKESIFSDLNHLKVVTTTSNKYETAFGFTQEEVFRTLDDYGLSREKEKVKEWYDGFIFGRIPDIYNPWSILNFLDTSEYEPYWANTSSNSLVSDLIRGASPSVKEMFYDLLEGKTIASSIDEQMVFNQLGRNEKSIFSLLLASGYLKVLTKEKRDQVDPSRDVTYELTLTNLEVSILFHRLVREWFEPVTDEYQGFVKAMLISDLEYMNEYMNQISLEMFSYFDTGKKAWNKECGGDPERFYHGFVLGLLVELKNRYLITSNRESGFGRYDITMKPKQENLPAIIIEFKVFNKRREDTLEDTVREALRQIEDKKYETSLIAEGIRRERIKKYGFAFKGKEVLIGAGDN